MAKDLQKEVERWSIVSGNILTGLCLKEWTIPCLTKWLEDNPISDVAEVACIKSAITECVNVAQKSTEEAMLLPKILVVLVVAAWKIPPSTVDPLHY